MCGKGTATTQNTSQTSTPNPQAMGLYQQLLQQASGVAGTPYQPYTGELTAPINQQQNTGIAGINSYQPAFQTGLGMAYSAAQPITTQQIEQYQSPFTQQVVNATEGQFNNQNAQQQQQLLGNAAAQGALGGNRVGVAQANLANQQQLAQAPVIANLENQGYMTGLNTALTEQQAQAQGAYGVANLANAGLTGANAQVGAGTLEQQTQQAGDVAQYQQYLNALGYPFQTTQWLAGLGTGVGSQMGGTTTGVGVTTPPPPNYLNTILGGISSGVGAAGAAGLFAGLARGGAVNFANGGGVAAPDIPVIPESHATLRAQQKQLVNGDRKVHMFPHGTPELSLPKGMQRVVGHSGVFHYNPSRISGERIKALAARGHEHEMLDLGPHSKHDILHRLVHGGERPVAVVERDPNGTEVRAALGTHNTARTQHEHMSRTKSKGHTLHFEHPHKVLAERHTAHRQSGGAVTNYSVFGGGYGQPTMPYSGGKSFIPGIGVVGGHGPPAAMPFVVPANASGQTSSMMNPATMKGFAGLSDTFKSLNKQDSGVASSDDDDEYAASDDNGDSGGKGGSDERRGGRIGVASYGPGGVADGDEFAMYEPDPNSRPYPEDFGRPIATQGVAPDDVPLPRERPALPDIDGVPLAQPRPDNDVPLPRPRPSGVLAPSPAADFVPLPRPRPAMVAPSAPVGVAAAPVSSTPMARPTTAAPPAAAAANGVARPAIDWGSSGKLWPTLIAAGAGMMASRSPYAGVALGEGLQSGLSTYGTLRQQEQSAALNAAKLNQAATKLSRDADFHERQLSETAKYHGGELANKAAELRMKEMEPKTIVGPDMQPHAVRKNVDGTYTDIWSGQILGADGRTVNTPQVIQPPRQPSTRQWGPSSSVPYAPAAPDPTAGLQAGGVPPEGDTPASDGDAPVPPPTALEGLSTAALPAWMGSVGAKPAAPAPGASPPEDDEAALPANSTLNEGELPEDLIPPMPPRDADYLSNLGPDDQRLVKNLVDYRIDPAKFFSIRQGKYGGDSERAKYLKMALRYDPSYDTTLYPAKQKATSDFLAGTAPNSSAQVLTAGNTAMLHVAEMYDLVDKMKNLPPAYRGWFSNTMDAITKGAQAAGIPYASYTAQYIKNHGLEGSPAGEFLNRWAVAKNRYSEEVTKFYSGGNGAESERERSLRLFDENKSPDELKGALSQDINMLNDKVKQYTNRLKAGMGPAAWRAALEKDPNLVVTYKNTRDVLNRLNGDDEARRARLGDVPQGWKAGAKAGVRGWMTPAGAFVPQQAQQ